MNSDSPNTADIVERLNDQLVETQMRAHKWMEAHDKLAAGKPYDLPKPADLPDALAEVAELRELVFESLYHLRTDARAEAYHNKASAALKDHRKAQAHER